MSYNPHKIRLNVKLRNNRGEGAGGSNKFRDVKNCFVVAKQLWGGGQQTNFWGLVKFWGVAKHLGREGSKTFWDDLTQNV